MLEGIESPVLGVITNELDIVSAKEYLNICSIPKLNYFFVSERLLVMQRQIVRLKNKI